jgi:hypothetical protein
VTGPLIIRRPCAPATPSAAARDIAEKQEELPEIPEASCSISLHEQALDVFKPKACVARTVVVFDPRHVLGPEMSVRHGVLLQATSATRRHALPIRPVTQRPVRWITFLANFLEARFGGEALAAQARHPEAGYRQ